MIEAVAALAVGPDGDGFTHAVKAGAGAAIHRYGGIGADKGCVVREVRGGKGNGAGLGITDREEVGDHAVIGNMAGHHILPLDDAGQLVVGNGDGHVAAQFVEGIPAPVRVGDHQGDVYHLGVLGNIFQGLLLGFVEVALVHALQRGGNLVLFAGDLIGHSIQGGTAEGDGSVLGGDSETAGLVVFAQLAYQVSGQHQLVHIGHAAQIHRHAAIGVFQDLIQVVLRDGDLGLAGIYLHRHVHIRFTVTSVHRHAVLYKEESLGVAVGCKADVVAGSEGGADGIAAGLSGYGVGPTAVYLILHRNLCRGVIGTDSGSHGGSVACQLLQLAQRNGVFLSAGHRQGACLKSNVIVLGGQAGESDGIGSDGPIGLVGTGKLGLAGKDALILPIHKALGSPGKSGGGLAVDDRGVRSTEGQLSLVHRKGKAGRGLHVLVGDSVSSGGDRGGARPLDGDLAADSVYHSHSRVRTGVSQLLVTVEGPVLSCIKHRRIAVGLGNGRDREADILLRQLGHIPGLGGIAAGAGAGLHTIVLLRGWRGEDPVPPVMAQGGDGLRLRVAAAGAGAGFGAVLGAGGLLGHGPVTPDVRTGGTDSVTAGAGGLLGAVVGAPVVAQGIHVGVHIAVMAAGTGVGGVTLLGTGRSGHHGLIIMAQSGEGHRFYLITQRAGAGLGAVQGAGGRRLCPLAPIVLTRREALLPAGQIGDGHGAGGVPILGGIYRPGQIVGFLHQGVIGQRHFGGQRRTGIAGHSAAKRIGQFCAVKAGLCIRLDPVVISRREAGDAHGVKGVCLRFPGAGIYHAASGILRGLRGDGQIDILLVDRVPEGSVQGMGDHAHFGVVSVQIPVERMGLHDVAGGPGGARRSRKPAPGIRVRMIQIDIVSFQCGEFAVKHDLQIRASVIAGGSAVSEIHLGGFGYACCRFVDRFPAAFVGDGHGQLGRTGHGGIELEHPVGGIRQQRLTVSHHRNILSGHGLRGGAHASRSGQDLGMRLVLVNVVRYDAVDLSHSQTAGLHRVLAVGLPGKYRFGGQVGSLRFADGQVDGPFVAAED